MATDRTEVRIIVVLAALQQQAEDAAIAADPTGGAGTFVPGVPLREAGDPTNTIVAYWTRWQMAPGQVSAFAQNMGGPMNTLSLGDSVNLSRDRWMFNGNEGQWTPEAVLAALGFDRLIPPEI